MAGSENSKSLHKYRKKQMNKYLYAIKKLIEILYVKYM